MATNLAIDDSLIIQAQKLGHHRSKKEAVTQALMEYIQHKKQVKVIKLFGEIEYSSDYDYKKSRFRK